MPSVPLKWIGCGTRPRRCKRGLACLVELQIRDVPKVFEVAGNQHQVVRNGSSSNEEIRLVNELAFASQIATKGGIAFGNGATNANHRVVCRNNRKPCSETTRFCP